MDTEIRIRNVITSSESKQNQHEEPKRDASQRLGYNKYTKNSYNSNINIPILLII